MDAIKLPQVRTRKQLEEQGIARIETNEWWGFGDDGEFKYVLNIIKKGLVFKYEKTENYPHKTIKSCIEQYNHGFTPCK